jgi:hypothetical protein
MPTLARRSLNLTVRTLGDEKSWSVKLGNVRPVAAGAGVDTVAGMTEVVDAKLR